MKEIKCLELEIAWITGLIKGKINSYFEVEPLEAEKPMPDLNEFDEPYSRFLRAMGLSPASRMVLMLALLPLLRPSSLDYLKVTDGNQLKATDFGGHEMPVHKGFIPTVETALFLLAGDDMVKRLEFMQFFRKQNPLFRDHWLKLEQIGPHEPFTASLLLASQDLIDYVTTGSLGEPEFGATFPAERIETTRSWDELVLPAETQSEIQDILHWITHERHVMLEMGLRGKVAPGFRALFHGPPGTGKTFTASLIGKATGLHVYRIDLSMVVSKYIGETEKNLKLVFDKAQSRGWILFFDEADALFGKRTDVSDSKDRYANQEVSYLLQRVENFDGIVILATNNRDNMDKAFTRRFQSVVNFPMPSAAERLLLWEKAIPDTYSISSTANLSMIAERYEIAGGSIMNVVRHCALRAAVRGIPVIEGIDILEGMRKEYKKSGKIMN